MVGTCQILSCCRKRKKERSVNSEVTESVTFLQLFRFASKTDNILISLAVAAALLNGVCLPLAVIVFGNLANDIVELSPSGTQNLTTTNATHCKAALDSVRVDYYAYKYIYILQYYYFN